MKTQKNVTFILLLLLLLYSAEAQNPTSFYPFKGFHVGITGQAEFIQKPTYVALTGTDPAPKARWSYGWEAGMEFSYHFAKYFGVSIGINYGTIFAYTRDVYLSTVPKINPGGTWDEEWKEVNMYDPFRKPGPSMKETEMLIPIKLEFHYPLRKDLFFTAEVGVKLQGLFKRLDYDKNDIGGYATGYGYWIKPHTGTQGIIINYYDDVGWRNLTKVNCHLLLGIGLYYKLPYGDLLRFTTGVNISFKNIIEGYYVYHLTDSYGTFAVKNDFIYTQLSYIHTLNWQKAKKYLKKQEISFSSKKERRQEIMKLLKDR